jgi:polysaccharide pyruvyl transferase CsaB
MTNILISGYIGFGNCGDEAILTALMADLGRLVPDANFTVLSRRPEQTAARYGVTSIDRFNFRQVVSAIRRADLVISGGGSLLQDATSSRSLYYYLMIISLAKWASKPVVVYANGIGPIDRPANRRLTRHILNQVDLITLRDVQSGEEVRRLGVVRPPIEVTADPAFSLTAAPAESTIPLLERPEPERERPLVGISVRRWQGSEIWGPAMAAAADHLCEAYGADIIFLPMQLPDDIEVSETITGLMRHRAAIVRDRVPADRYLALVGQLDFLIGMRLHALIFAARQQVPLLGLAYDPKVTGVLDYIGQPCAGDPARIDADRLIAAADLVMQNRSEMRGRLAERTEDLARLARRNAELVAELLTTGRRGRRNRSQGDGMS